MKCPKCGFANDDNAKFCKSCGAEIIVQKKNFCTGCGVALQEDSTFCPECGKKKDTKVDNSTTVVSGKKSKSTAILLAFLFGPFGLIYTWKKDWILFVCLVVGTLFIHGILGYEGEGSPLVNLLPWIITVIYRLSQPREKIEA